MKRILNLWFGFSQTVTRRTYIVSGLSLMVLKYVVDSLIFRGSQCILIRYNI